MKNVHEYKLVMELFVLGQIGYIWSVQFRKVPSKTTFSSRLAEVPTEQCQQSVCEQETKSATLYNKTFQ